MDNSFRSFYKLKRMLMIYQTIDYPTNQFWKTTKYKSMNEIQKTKSRRFTICKICSTIIFVVVCNRSAEFKLESMLRNSSRNVNKPHDDEAFSSRIKSGIPIKSI